MKPLIIATLAAFTPAVFAANQADLKILSSAYNHLGDDEDEPNSWSVSGFLPKGLGDKNHQVQIELLATISFTYQFSKPDLTDQASDKAKSSVPVKVKTSVRSEDFIVAVDAALTPRPNKKSKTTGYLFSVQDVVDPEALARSIEGMPGATITGVTLDTLHIRAVLTDSNGGVVTGNPYFSSLHGLEEIETIEP